MNHGRYRVWHWRSWSVRYAPPALLLAALLMVLLLVMAAYGLTVGSMRVPLADVVAIVMGHDESGLSARIVLDIRLPRILAAIFVGAALGVSGAIFQSISRNPLGSPDLIGFTTGAATGALTLILFFSPSVLQITLAATVGGLATALIVYLFALKGGGGGYRLILIGLGVGSTLSAVNGLLLVRGDLDDALWANIWLAGSLNGRTWSQVWPLMLGVVVLVPVVCFGARALTLLEMGDDIARQLGVPTERLRLGMIMCAVILAALATGTAGPIAFIALAAPQLSRSLLPGVALPVLCSACMGAGLLLLADLLIQALPLAVSVPVGRMTGIVGGLYLLWLLTRQR
ncbi:MAG: iron chelate uptake ABC transporter family permease subunit [Gammaproteobacteria bacterium]|nr:iron chelate uptake ABC transporter family permease subunit [Gammaproteobacteria bacterium]